MSAEWDLGGEWVLVLDPGAHPTPALQVREVPAVKCRRCGAEPGAECASLRKSVAGLVSPSAAFPFLVHGERFEGGLAQITNSMMLSGLIPGAD